MHVRAHASLLLVLAFGCAPEAPRVTIVHELAGSPRVVLAVGSGCDDPVPSIRSFHALADALPRPALRGPHALQVTLYDAVTCERVAFGCAVAEGGEDLRVPVSAVSGPCTNCGCGRPTPDAGLDAGTDGGPEDGGHADVGSDAGTDPDACAARTYPEVIVADTPAAYYRFEESAPSGTAADEVGAHNARYGAGGHELFASPIAGQAVRLSSASGDTPRVLVPNSLRTVLFSGSVTIELWMRRIGFDSTFDQNTLFVCSEHLFQGYRFLHREDGRLTFLTRNLGADTVVESAPGVVDGEWHHYALTIDGTTVEGFVDGERVFRETEADIVHLPERSMELGIGHVNGVRSRTETDELAIYDRPLDNDTLRAHHAAGLAGGDCGG